MKIAYEINGGMTNKHCSDTCSINCCNKLKVTTHRCRLFQIQLEYDWDYHGFKRCEECLEDEIKEG